ncbi:MAG: hypothetical protein RLY86_3322 [Pseudomonadota bacterium]|jgi:virulence-associated protein VagC
MAAIAKLTMTDEGQSVLLPKGMELPGNVVRVRKDEGGVHLEPATPEDDEAAREERRRSIEAFFAKMDKYRQEVGEFMPEGREQPPMPPDRDYGWD